MGDPVAAPDADAVVAAARLIALEMPPECVAGVATVLAQLAEHLAVVEDDG